MAKKEEKSKAELYREERKQRLEKSAKKREKQKAKPASGIAKVGKRILAVVLVLAIVAGVGYMILTQTGMHYRLMPVAKVGDQNISASVYAYYYKQNFNGLYQQFYQMAQYGMGQMVGYDATMSPYDQKVSESSYQSIMQTEDKLPEEIKNWGLFMESLAEDAVQRTFSLYQEISKNEKYQTLTDEETEALEKEVEELTAEAKKSGYSLNAYLRAVYGHGFNEKALREQIKMESIAERYTTDMDTENQKKYPDATVIDLYNKGEKENYDVVSYRSYVFTAETVEQKEGESNEAFDARKATAKQDAQNKARAFEEKLTDEASFLAAAAAAEGNSEAYDADTQTSNQRQTKEKAASVGKGADTWLFANDRKTGDTKVFENDETGTYNIVFVVTPRFAPHQVQVRHILAAFPDNGKDEEGNAVEPSEAQKRETKLKADAILAEWEKGAKTEDSFAALATAKTEDPGSKETGGLYSVNGDSEMQQGFKDWALNSTRKVGDVEIVETAVGYHIMYFGKAEPNKPDYIEQLRKSKSADDIVAYQEEIFARDEYQMTKNTSVLNWVNKECREWAEQITRNGAAQLQSAKTQ